MKNGYKGKTAKKPAFLEALEKSLGIIHPACIAVGICRETYRNWYRSDPEFAKKADEIIDMQLDFAESQLLQKIKEGDTTAIIFYLKTKAKKRGYVEKQELAVQEIPPNEYIVADEDTAKKLAQAERDGL